MKNLYVLFVVVTLILSCTSQKKMVQIQFEEDKTTVAQFLTEMKSYNTDYELLGMVVKEPGNHTPVGIGLHDVKNQNLDDIAKKISDWYQVNYDEPQTFLTKFYASEASLSVSQKVSQKLQERGYKVHPSE